ncbi:nucleotide-binding site protein [Artemisia annua]|uniref:ADP-ribosyl cyclase/cyclic ADP-ribose hydrolase n=1 Tax=Artemisia annua TaxID=35608 RepID=A0A2U1LDX1_ARTAN|nr:nucleotide-binding site protein [Artemisia annua]
MASTSLPSCSTSASSSQVWNYDVYLSFRGRDTRYTFVDHLHAALRQRGICTFIDTESLTHGAHTARSFSKAISESRIAVVVLSKNYADSRRCLNQLAMITHMKKEIDQIVIPIYYHVDPSDVQKQTGTYEEAFLKHELINSENVEFWRKALEELNSHPGWVLNKDPYR